MMRLLRLKLLISLLWSLRICCSQQVVETGWTSGRVAIGLMMVAACSAAPASSEALSSEKSLAVYEYYSSIYCPSCKNGALLTSKFADEVRTGQTTHAIFLQWHSDVLEGPNYKDHHSSALATARMRLAKATIDKNRSGTLGTMTVNGREIIDTVNDAEVRESLAATAAAIAAAPPSKANVTIIAEAVNTAPTSTPLIRLKWSAVAPYSADLEFIIVEDGVDVLLSPGRSKKTRKTSGLVRFAKVMVLPPASSARRGTMTLPLPVDMRRRNGYMVAMLRQTGTSYILYATRMPLP